MLLLAIYIYQAIPIVPTVHIFLFKHFLLISLILLLICFWLHLYLYYVQLHILDKSILSHLNLLLLHFYIHNNYIFDYLQKIYLLLLRRLALNFLIFLLSTDYILSHSSTCLGLPTSTNFGVLPSRGIVVEPLGENNKIVFGESKYSKKQVGLSILKQLQEKAKNVKWNNNNREEYFILFSKSGFSEELEELAQKEKNIILKKLI